MDGPLCFTPRGATQCPPFSQLTCNAADKMPVKVATSVAHASVRASLAAKVDVSVCRHARLLAHATVAVRSCVFQQGADRDEAGIGRRGGIKRFRLAQKHAAAVVSDRWRQVATLRHTV